MPARSLTEVGFSDFTTPKELKTAITENTAAIFYIARFEILSSPLSPRDVIEVAQDANVPMIVEAADGLPPLENLGKITTWEQTS